MGKCLCKCFDSGKCNENSHFPENFKFNLLRKLLRFVNWFCNVLWWMCMLENFTCIMYLCGKNNSRLLRLILVPREIWKIIWNICDLKGFKWLKKIFLGSKDSKDSHIFNNLLNSKSTKGSIIFFTTTLNKLSRMKK